MNVKYLILELLAAASLIGAYVTRHFADRKLGFVRWLNFNGNKLRDSLPTDVIKFVALALIVILFAIAVWRFVRNRPKMNAADVVATVAAIAACTYYVYATFAIVPTVTPCSFIVVPLIGLAAYLLVFRTLLMLFKTED